MLSIFFILRRFFVCNFLFIGHVDITIGFRASHQLAIGVKLIELADASEYPLAARHCKCVLGHDLIFTLLG